MRALVMEDEPLVAMLIKENLAELGYAVEVVDTEQQALASATEHRPDLITADVILHEGSGIEAVHRICGDGHIPTVFIVGWLHGDELDALPHATVMRKPFETSTLYAAVSEARFHATGVPAA
jgi:CheY-like chemotaxis protein